MSILSPPPHWAPRLARRAFVAFALAGAACSTGGTPTTTETGTTKAVIYPPESTSTTELDPSGGTGGVSGSCDSVCAVRFSCDPNTEPDCVESCEQSSITWDVVGTCADPFQELLECISGLSCDEYDLFAQAVGDYPCKDESAVLGDEMGNPHECAYERIPEACLDFCSTALMCAGEGDEALCGAQCNLDLGNAAQLGDACVAATEARYWCYAAAECDALENDPELCAAEVQAVQDAC